MAVINEMLDSIVNKLRNSSLVRAAFVERLGGNAMLDYAVNNLPAVLVGYDGSDFGQVTPIGTRRQPIFANVSVYIIGRYPAPQDEDYVFTVMEGVYKTLRQEIITSYPGSYATIVNEVLDELLPTALIYRQTYRINLGGEF